MIPYDPDHERDTIRELAEEEARAMWDQDCTVRLRDGDRVALWDVPGIMGTVIDAQAYGSSVLVRWDGQEGPASRERIESWFSLRPIGPGYRPEAYFGPSICFLPPGLQARVEAAAAAAEAIDPVPF